VKDDREIIWEKKGRRISKGKERDQPFCIGEEGKSKIFVRGFSSG